jgi:hypothetical protein
MQLIIEEFSMTVTVTIVAFYITTSSSLIIRTMRERMRNYQGSRFSWNTKNTKEALLLLSI